MLRLIKKEKMAEKGKGKSEPTGTEKPKSFFLTS